MTAKIIPLGCITRLDLPADRVIDALREADLEGVVVMGYRKEEAGGELYFASSYANGGSTGRRRRAAGARRLRLTRTRAACRRACARPA